MDNTKIHLRVAANDKLLIIEQKLFLSKLSIGIITLLIITSYIGITLQIGIICALIITWIYTQDKKEHQRMRNKYAI